MFQQKIKELVKNKISDYFLSGSSIFYEEIEKMKKEAEEHAEEDKKKKLLMMTRNSPTPCAANGARASSVGLCPASKFAWSTRRTWWSTPVSPDRSRFGVRPSSRSTGAARRDGRGLHGRRLVPDRGSQSVHGAYRILGRISVDILKTGGEKISALEIEDVLRSHPAVRTVPWSACPIPIGVTACALRSGQGLFAAHDGGPSLLRERAPRSVQGSQADPAGRRTCRATPWAR